MIKINKSAIPLVILAFAFSRGIQRVLTALALREMPPWSITAISLVLACAIWVPIAIGKGWLIRDLRLWLRCIPLGLVNIAIPAIAFIAAQKYVSASVTALLVASLPIFIAVFAAFLLGEHLRMPALFGIVLGSIGVIILTIGKGGALNGANWWLGVTLIGVGILTAASVYVGWRSLLAQYSPVLILGPQLVISAIVVTVVAYAIDGFRVPPIHVLAILTSLSIVNYIIPQLAMFWLIARTTAVRSAIANYLAPLFATLIAIPVLDQRVSPLIIAGGLLIIAGAVFVNTARARTKLV